MPPVRLQGPPREVTRTFRKDGVTRGTVRAPPLSFESSYDGSVTRASGYSAALPFSPFAEATGRPFRASRATAKRFCARNRKFRIPSFQLWSFGGPHRSPYGIGTSRKRTPRRIASILSSSLNAIPSCTTWSFPSSSRRNTQNPLWLSREYAPRDLLQVPVVGDIEKEVQEPVPDPVLGRHRPPVEGREPVPREEIEVFVEELLHESRDQFDRVGRVPVGRRDDLSKRRGEPRFVRPAVAPAPLRDDSRSLGLRDRRGPVARRSVDDEDLPVDRLAREDRSVRFGRGGPKRRSTCAMDAASLRVGMTRVARIGGEEPTGHSLKSSFGPRGDHEGAQGSRGPTPPVGSFPTTADVGIWATGR